MADQYRGRTRRNDDSMVPLLTVLVVIAAAGPALFTALTQWLVPRLTAGRDAVSLSLGEWWDRNWWLVLFWVLELAVLFAFLAWSRRRRSRRTRQLDSVVTGLTRVMPADWEPDRDLRVQRWNGHRPVRLRLQLTPRSALDDAGWRRSVAEAARKVLGPLEPIAWPQPPRNGVFDWGVRPPRVELRVGRSRSGGGFDRARLRESNRRTTVGNPTTMESERSERLPGGPTDLPAAAPGTHRAGHGRPRVSVDSARQRGLNEWSYGTPGWWRSYCSRCWVW